MKFIVILSLGLFFSHTALAQQVPVYLYFASHNETTDQNFHGLNYSDPVDYAVKHDYIRQVCDTMLHYGAAYEMMLESRFGKLWCSTDSQAVIP